MSVQATTWVWNHSTAEGTDRLVLLALADHAHPDGTHAFPTVAEIGRMVGVSARTVQRSLARLREIGELQIVREATRYTPNQYGLPGVGRGDTRGANLSPLDPAGVTTGASGVTGDATRGDTATSPEPIEPIEPTVLEPRSASRVRATPPRRRPTPIPDDFTVTADMRSWARDKGILGNLTRETERFTDYWKGAGKTKADWLATWRNWISKEADNPRNQTIRRSISSTYDEHIQTEDERVAEWEAEKRRSAKDAERNGAAVLDLFRSVPS